MEDLYALLEVSRDASDAEIKKSYRNLIKKYHPDLHPGDIEAEERFKKINAAYSVLGDPEKRANYDRFGSEDAGFHGHNMNDLFGDLFADVFGGGSHFNININMGNSPRNRRVPRQGQHIEKSISITLLEAYNGITKTYKVSKWSKCNKCKGTGNKDGSKPERCSKCNGTGQIRNVQRNGFMQMVNVTTCHECKGEGEIIRDKCLECNGIGQIDNKHEIEVKIPIGIESGTRLRIPGSGNAGIHGGEPGDLFIIVYVERNSKFERDGVDLHMQLSITYPDAVLGTTIELELLNGDKEKVEIPAGSHHGQVLTIKNKGMPYMRNNNKYGNLYIHLLIDIPTSLTSREKKLIMELSKEMKKEKQQIS